MERYYEHIYTVSSYCLISLLAEMCDICADFSDMCKVLTLCVLAMSWLRQLVVALSVQRPNFNPRMLYGEFVVDRVTVRQVFLCQYPSTNALYLSKTLFIVPTDAHHYKIIEMLKQFKIVTLAPTCFSSCRNHHQGAVLCLAKTTNMVFLCSSV